MAITIRNKKTEELIRTIGRPGEGPSAVIRRLAESEARDRQEVPTEVARQRIERLKELSRKYPPPDPKPGRTEIEQEMEALFDYMDEEPARKRAEREGR